MYTQAKEGTFGDCEVLLYLRVNTVHSPAGIPYKTGVMDKLTFREVSTITNIVINEVLISFRGRDRWERQGGGKVAIITHGFLF